MALVYAHLCLLEDFEKETAAQAPGNKAVLPQGCRAKGTQALRHHCSGRALPLADEVGTGFQGPATPGRGAGT